MMVDSVKMNSTEAEYIQCSKCSRDVDFYRNLFIEFFCKHDDTILFDDSPSDVAEDNKGCTDVVQGGVNSKKLRHLQHHEHFCRDCQERKIINCKKIGTDDNTADLMTKPPRSRRQMDKLFIGKGMNLYIR